MSKPFGKNMLESSLAIPKTLTNGIRNTVIIGLNRNGILAYHRIKEQLRNKENLIGIIDVHERPRPVNGEMNSISYIGQLKDFTKLRKEFGINHVLIAVDSQDVSKVHEIIKHCKNNRIKYEFAAEMQDIVFGNTIQEIWRDLHRPWQPSKRQVIYSISALTLILLFFPLFLVTSILIKLDSRGPIFYSQERVGINGRLFRIFKFRSMTIDAEKLSGPVLASKNDSRVTRVGRFLRRTRIDEIPQLINVVIGDMHFIGPRPERPYFVEKYSREIPMYKNRLKVKPGISGLAQVTTGYDEKLEDVKDKLKYDLDYIENYYSIQMHLNILLKTIKVIFTAQGH
ncbi:MAG: exopolysaccharide biosynthesis polyprenyl glycosylphosphotransferase [Calditrichia bacterium]|nr:exopolysaccharide biosynthesis polyprenyl glycosylphosphotransferase [Calditrichia bacterium]